MFHETTDFEQTNNFSLTKVYHFFISNILFVSSEADISYENFAVYASDSESSLLNLLFNTFWLPTYMQELYFRGCKTILILASASWKIIDFQQKTRKIESTNSGKPVRFK